MKNQILLEAKNMQDELTKWRHSLHRIPELGLHLPHTTAFVKEQLSEMDIEFTEYEECSCITAQKKASAACSQNGRDTGAFLIFCKFYIHF